MKLDFETLPDGGAKFDADQFEGLQIYIELLIKKESEALELWSSSNEENNAIIERLYDQSETEADKRTEIIQTIQWHLKRGETQEALLNLERHADQLCEADIDKFKD